MVVCSYRTAKIPGQSGIARYKKHIYEEVNELSSIGGTPLARSRTDKMSSNSWGMMRLSGSILGPQKCNGSTKYSSHSIGYSASDGPIGEFVKLGILQAAGMHYGVQVIGGVHPCFPMMENPERRLRPRRGIYPTVRVTIDRIA